MTALHPATRPTIPDLLPQRQAELDILFAALPSVTREQVRGHFRGAVMAVRGLEILPRPLARSLYALLSSPLGPTPWRGKSFAGARGSNRWFTNHGAAFGHFRLRSGESPVDGQPTLLLDYDVPENPRPLRAIRGEVRNLGEGLLLARMSWQAKTGLRRVLYFTLTRAERSDAS